MHSVTSANDSNHAMPGFSEHAEGAAADHAAHGYSTSSGHRDPAGISAGRGSASNRSELAAMGNASNRSDRGGYGTSGHSNASHSHRHSTDVTPTGLSLFITRLHVSTEWRHLFELFKEFDEHVEIRILSDFNKQSRGIGYVNFTTPAAAAAALSLDKSIGPFGHQIRIEYAKVDSRFVAEETSKLFIRQVPPQTTEHDLQTLFQEFGAIQEVKIHKDTSTAGQREQTTCNMAYITYDAFASASLAMKGLHRKVTLPGAEVPIDVCYAESLAVRNKRRQMNTQHQLSHQR
jgi:RNA recognition motif-containing protein